MFFHDMHDFEDSSTKKRRDFQLSRRAAFHTPITDQYGDAKNELQQLAEFQERTRYRLLASRRNSLNVSASSDEPDGVGIPIPGLGTRRPSLRLRSYVMSPGPSSLKAIPVNICAHHFVLFSIFLFL